MDRKGENIIIYPAIVIMALGILLLSQAQNSVMLLASAALLGFGFGNIQSVCQTIAVKSTTLQRMGLATSTFFIALDAGLGFGLISWVCCWTRLVIASFICSRRCSP